MDRGVFRPCDSPEALRSRFIRSRALLLFRARASRHSGRNPEPCCSGALDTRPSLPLLEAATRSPGSSSPGVPPPLQRHQSGESFSATGPEGSASAAPAPFEAAADTLSPGRPRVCLTRDGSAFRVSHPPGGLLLTEPCRSVSPVKRPWGSVSRRPPTAPGGARRCKQHPWSAHHLTAPAFPHRLTRWSRTGSISRPRRADPLTSVSQPARQLPEGSTAGNPYQISLRSAVRASGGGLAPSAPPLAVPAPPSPCQVTRLAGLIQPRLEARRPLARHGTGSVFESSTLQFRCPLQRFGTRTGRPDVVRAGRSHEVRPLPSVLSPHGVASHWLTLPLRP